MRIYNEEIFGPVLSVVRVSTYEEALELKIIINMVTAPVFILQMGKFPVILLQTAI